MSNVPWYDQYLGADAEHIIAQDMQNLLSELRGDFDWNISVTDNMIARQGGRSVVIWRMENGGMSQIFLHDDEVEGEFVFRSSAAAAVFNFYRHSIIRLAYGVKR